MKALKAGFQFPGSGIYLFEDEASAERYVQEHTARLQSFGIKDIWARQFAVNQPLTQITRGNIPVVARQYCETKNISRYKLSKDVVTGLGVSIFNIDTPFFA